MKIFLHILNISVISILLFSCNKEEKIEKAAIEMQAFVGEISAYAKGLNPGFVIIPQNGIQLAFNNTKSENGINLNYLEAIDGFALEELFYNKKALDVDERYEYLQELKQYKKIMVSEFVKNSDDIADAYQKNNNENFACFVRSNDNYYYNQIPSSVYNENSNNITQLAEIKNFLYLINAENYSSKQQLIDALRNTNFDLLLIDLFFNDEQLSAADIAQLKTKKNGAQRLVISYMNIGSAENYRYYWKSDWKLHHPKWIKKRYKGYKDEYYVEFWNQEWKDVIYGNNESYLKKIIDTGFDGVFLDNVEAYYFLYKNN